MRRYRILQCLSLLPMLVFSASLLPGQTIDTNVLTWKNNIWRDGLNSTETTLTQANVKKGKFGKICSTKPGAIDGQISAQPLLATGTIKGYIHVVYIATMNNSVYFIDGDSSDCRVIKHVSLLPAHEQAVKCEDVGGMQCTTLAPIIGVLGTPVIDMGTNTMFLVTWTESKIGGCPTTKAPSCFWHRLHALDLTTGAEKFNGPVVIPSISSSEATFTSYNHLQRPGLLELPSVEANGDSGIYVAFSSMDGSGLVGRNLPSGWMFRFDAKDLSAAPVSWASTPNGEGGGLWLSGAGIAAGIDKSGGQPFLYVSTGDGTFDAENGGSDYGDSLVKLTTNLTVSDYFTPYRQYCDQQDDGDLGAGGVMLIPNGVASSTLDFAVANGKDGNIYVVDRANLGGYAGPASNVCPAPPPGPNFNIETIAAGTNQFYSTPAFWNRTLYSQANNAALEKYPIGGAACSPGPICSTPAASSTNKFPYGSVPVVSANAVTSGTAILWTVHGNGWPSAKATVTPVPAVLYAFDAEHVIAPATIPVLWNSNQCPIRDAPGNATKFVVPTVANGRVFMGTMDPSDTTNTKGRLDVYGPSTAVCN